MTSLQLTNVDLQRTTNATAHRTSYYDTTELVTRRGQGFNMNCTFSKPVQPADTLTITVETGPGPSESRNTRAVMRVSTSASGTAWSAVRGRSSNNTIPITINLPVNAVVGSYQMKIQTTSGGRTSSANMGSFVVLFNPWALGDECYMSNDAEKEEYVDNDAVAYWFGNASSFDSRAWDLGQHEKDILPICLTLLEKSSLYATDKAADVALRGDPIHVGRVMTAMVNNNDGDQGVVVGNWTGIYRGGVSPTSWNGSAAILRQWMKSGPVRFGQCWVYAGVLCTVLRCLGIPARMITNFASAHDTDGNLVIDYYYDSDGNRDNSMTNDSVWNFHAWVEMWCKRKDIGTFYDGWQIVDATPQEPSGGVYRLGPCSVTAVKEGDVDKLYDCAFVFAEVNADEKNWMKTDQGLRLLSSTTAVIGQRASTKAVGSFARQDVTINYKYAEGSAKEREIVRKAQNKLRPSAGFAAFGMSRMAVREAVEEKPEFSATFKNYDATVGDDLNIVLQCKADKNTTLKADVHASSIVYNNTEVKKISTQSYTLTIGANEEKDITINIKYDQYKDAITADNMIDIVAVCQDETEGKLVVTKVLKLKNPPLVITIKEAAKEKKTTTVDIKFTNPLKEDLIGSRLSVQGSGLMKDPVTIEAPLIKSGQSHTFTVKITPYRSGSRCFVADFTSQKIPNVKAYQSISVAPA